MIFLCCYGHFLRRIYDTADRRGAYRRVVAAEEDAFNDNFDEHDLDEYYDEEETNGISIEMKDLDNGKLTLDEVNG